MKYYVSKTDVSLDKAGKLAYAERVLTKPDTLKATKEAIHRYRAIGIEHIHLCEHPANSRRWGQLQRAQNKLRKTRKMTLADVAKDLAELEKEAAEKEANNS